MNESFQIHYQGHDICSCSLTDQTWKSHINLQYDILHSYPLPLFHCRVLPHALTAVLLQLWGPRECAQCTLIMATRMAVPVLRTWCSNFADTNDFKNTRLLGTCTAVHKNLVNVDLVTSWTAIVTALDASYGRTQSSYTCCFLDRL